MPAPAVARPQRICDLCGGVDDHPRHVIDGVQNAAVTKEFLATLPDGLPAAAIAEAITDNVHSRHIDCCAANGCIQCQATEKATAGVRGLPLFDALAEARANGFEEPEITSNKELGLDG